MRTVLRRLRIENLVLIREAELELAPGLNAITGETGAGKTILAQAIGLLLGTKGDAAGVGPARTFQGASDSKAGRAIQVPSPRRKWRRLSWKWRWAARVCAIIRSCWLRVAGSWLLVAGC